MRVPHLRGIIERRILVNYHVDPELLARLLPEPFRPKLVRNCGIAGICLIRLRGIRPSFLPAVFGIRSENAAHRVAVEWERDGQLREGVYIPRRDTSSRLNTLVGGRLFPGVHHHAKFRVEEREDWYKVCMDSDDGAAHLRVEARLGHELPAGSLFRSVREASEFFRRGSLGYSDTTRSGEFDGLELRTLDWRVQPLAVDRVESSFFDDPQQFPPAAAKFDCALLMREVEHEWCEQPSLCCEPAAI